MKFKKTTYSKMKTLISRKHGKKSSYSCQKSYFSSPRRAANKLEMIKFQEPRSNKKPTRFYKCLKCEGFHLTSLNKELYLILLNKRATTRKKNIEIIANHWKNKLNVKKN